MAMAEGTEILYKKESRLGVTTLTFRNKRFSFPSVIIKSDLKSEGMCILLDVGLFCPFCAGSFKAKLIRSRSRFAVTKDSSYDEAMKQMENKCQHDYIDFSHSSPYDSKDSMKTQKLRPDTETFEDKIANFEKTLEEMQNKETFRGPSALPPEGDRINRKGTETTNSNTFFKNRNMFIECDEAQMTFKHEKTRHLGSKTHTEHFEINPEDSQSDIQKHVVYRDPCFPSPEVLLKGKLMKADWASGKHTDSEAGPDGEKHTTPDESTDNNDTEIITELLLNTQKDLADIQGDFSPDQEGITLELKHVTNIEKGMCTTSAVKTMPIEGHVFDKHSLSPSPIVEGSILSDYGSMEPPSHDTSLQDINVNMDTTTRSVSESQMHETQFITPRKRALHFKKRTLSQGAEELKSSKRTKKKKVPTATLR